MPWHNHCKLLFKKSIKKKLATPEIPDTANGFMLLIKQYANLTVDLLSETISLFWSLVKIIDSIKAFSRIVYNAMNIKIKA